ncbi:MAG: ATP-binding protein [Campylobacterales bacterium]|jgi:predicted AAA+ superfamily ATPase
MIELLEKFYRQDLHAGGYVERKFSPPTHSFYLSGIALCGKTMSIKHYLLQQKKSSYLYIDCSDIRIDTERFNAQIRSFCNTNEVTTVVLDNYRPELTLPSVEQLILIGREPVDETGFAHYRLAPLDFEEFLAFERKYDESALNDFLQLGGFPVMHKTPSEERNLLLQRTFRHALDDIGFDLLQLAARLHTQKVSAFMLYERLKAERKISKDMLYRHYERMISAGYLHAVAKFGHPRATKKLYLCDIALKNALVFQKHFGRLFENMVLTELVKHHDDLYYEEQIDFYLPESGRVILCMPFGTKDILFKKIEQAEAFIVTHGVEKVEVITMSSESSLHHPFVRAEMIPFAQWALSEGEEAGDE